MKQQRKQYTPEFKREAVAMVTQQGHRYAEAARMDTENKHHHAAALGARAA
ncbi:MAG: transposase [Gammaproteobacteria bacterium]|nr:transposase [Gammaproteobacteria bacterium]